MTARDVQMWAVIRGDGSIVDDSIRHSRRATVWDFRKSIGERPTPEELPPEFVAIGYRVTRVTVSEVQDD